MMPSSFGCAARCDGRVEPEHVREHRAGVVLETWDDPGRYPGEQDRLQVGAALAGLDERGEIGEHPGIQRRQQRRELGVGDVAGERLVVSGRQRVPQVLLAQRDENLVDERIAQSRHLPERAAVEVFPALGVPQPHPLPARRRPHADHRTRAAWPVWPAGGQLPGGDLDGDGVHVQRRGRVHPGAGLLKTFMPYWLCNCSKGRRLARSKIEPRST